MRFKLDENLHVGLKNVLVAAGHEASTVYDEGLQGATDSEVWTICCRESRILVTLDMDFSDKRRYPVRETPGIIVLRGHNDTSIPLQRRLIARVIVDIARHSPADHRWIVDSTSIRVST